MSMSLKQLRPDGPIFQVGEILKKDKSSCTASVQLLQDRDTLLTLDYDVICEYTGDIQAEFDY